MRFDNLQSDPAAVRQKHIKCGESRVELGALFAGFQVAVEETLDGAQALVHGFAGQAAPARGGRLVATPPGRPLLPDRSFHVSATRAASRKERAVSERSVTSLPTLAPRRRATVQQLTTPSTAPTC